MDSLNKVSPLAEFISAGLAHGSSSLCDVQCVYQALFLQTFFNNFNMSSAVLRDSQEQTLEHLESRPAAYLTDLCWNLPPQRQLRHQVSVGPCVGVLSAFVNNILSNVVVVVVLVLVLFVEDDHLEHTEIVTVKAPDTHTYTLPNKII